MFKTTLVLTNDSLHTYNFDATFSHHYSHGQSAQLQHEKSHSFNVFNPAGQLQRSVKLKLNCFVNSGYKL